MAHLPISVREKLAGAHEEFERLQAEVVAFGNDKPYAVVYEHNSEFTEHSLRLRFSKPFPGPRWGRMFGIGVQGLRSALNHLVYAIAIHETGKDPPPDYGVLGFPLITNPPDESPMRMIETLSDEVRTAIKAEQPDPSRMHESPLWQLHQFNRTDKHRVIHFTTARFSEGEVEFETGPMGVSSAKLQLARLEHEAPFVTLTTPEPWPHMNMRSRTSSFVSVERVGGDGKLQDFLPLGQVVSALERATLGIIERVATAARL